MSDDWYTPKYIFDALGVTFDLDVAAPIEGPRYVPARTFITERTDGLHANWQGYMGIDHAPFVWMNPPYGHQRTKRNWLQKFVENQNGIALMPDRTSAPWFQEFVPHMDMLLFTNGKIKFERPDGSIGEQPGNGTCLMAIGTEGTIALRNADRAGLGLTVKPRATIV